MASGASGQGPMDFGPLPIRGSAYRRWVLSPEQQMMSVYGRVLLHITILGGAFVVGFFGTPFAALVLLVGLKTAIDLFFHLREHQRAEALAA